MSAPTNEQNFKALVYSSLLWVGIYALGYVVDSHPDPFPAVLGFFFGFRSGVLSA